MQQGTREDDRRAARIEALIEEVAAYPDQEARARSEELVQAILDMYGDGLARILEIAVRSEASGIALIEALARDDLVSSLLLLHGLHPLDIETRITRALDELRPYLKSHGGNAALIKVENGIAYLRLEGSCQGCSSSTTTLKSAIEEAVYRAAPDLDELRIESISDPPRQGMPVTFVPPRRRKEGTRTATTG